MKSLIRSDFYKLRKAKSFWVCMILAVALAVFSVLIMDFSVKLMDKVPQQAAQEEAALEESGLNISTDGIPMSSADLNASSMLLMQFAGTTTLLISIFVSLFVGGEFSHGTIKNLASKNYTRTQIYLSKIIVSVIAAIVMTLLYAIVATGLGTALWGFGKVDSSFAANACKGIAIEFLLVSAFTAVFVMFSMLIRQNGGAIAANIFFLEFISLIVMFGEMIINKIFDTLSHSRII
ncbi:MAG: ABC transporter permease subunit [Coprococcus sp.]